MGIAEVTVSTGTSAFYFYYEFKASLFHINYFSKQIGNWVNSFRTNLGWILFSNVFPTNTIYTSSIQFITLFPINIGRYFQKKKEKDKRKKKAIS